MDSDLYTMGIIFEDKVRNLNMQDRQRRSLRTSRQEQLGLDTAHNRLFVVILMVGFCFAAISVRLFDLMIIEHSDKHKTASATTSPLDKLHRRADVVDRNGVVLATSLKTASVYADPKVVMDPSDAAYKISIVLPHLDEDDLYRKLTSNKRFVWLERGLSPKQQYEVNRLGIPGLEFVEEEQRFYPHGELISHILGYTDIDNTGIAGAEMTFDEDLKEGKTPLELSLDVRVQQIVHDTLNDVMRTHKAKGAVGIVMKAKSGEVVSSVSLPDFHPKFRKKVSGNALFNRSTAGVYEMGSTFKLFTAAMALDEKPSIFKRNYDTKNPIKVANFTVKDHRSYGDNLSFPEVFMYSSNIGAARIAGDTGLDKQKEFFHHIGLGDPSSIEVPESAAPLMPSRWDDITMHTMSYGYGASISPMKLTESIAGLVNGGVMKSATLVKGKKTEERQIISAKASQKLRELMYMTVQEGTGKKAKGSGYLMGGKTGTAVKMTSAGYTEGKQLASFVSAFPIHDPEYVVLVIFDEPEGTEETFGYANGGWVAAPAAKKIVQRMGPLVGIKPFDMPENRATQNLINIKY